MASATASIVQRNHDPERYTAHGLLRRNFKNGCSRVNMANSHGHRGYCARMLGSALGKFSISLFLLPFSVFSRSFFMHHLYRMAKSCGVMYNSLTGRTINYYWS